MGIGPVVWDIISTPTMGTDVESATVSPGLIGLVLTSETLVIIVDFINIIVSCTVMIYSSHADGQQWSVFFRHCRYILNSTDRETNMHSPSRYHSVHKSQSRDLRI